MNKKDDLITKVTWYYYMEGMTQENIASHFGISRLKVMKLLDQARKENIVQFKVVGKGVNCLKIEESLKKNFNLKDAFVIPRSFDDLSSSLSIAAAQYLEGKLSKNDIISFGWGETISKTISNLKIEKDINLSFVSLTGGVKYYILNTENSPIGISNKFKGKLYIIPSPLYVSSEQMAANTLSEPSVKEILDLSSIANYTLVGIGPLNNDATVIKEGLISINEMEVLLRQGAVGDILGQFYDEKGEKLPLSIHKRIISFDIRKFKEMSNVIAVAGGSSKIQAIKGALKGGYIDILITDEDTAEELINIDIL